MADLSIQFHALPDEVIQFAQDVVHDFGVTLVAIRVRPFDIREIDDPKALRRVLDESGFSRIAFLLGKPSLPAPDEPSFIKLNPDCLRLDIGQSAEDGLRQSWLSARTENREAIAIWRRVAAQLKRITHAGAIAVNPTTGASGFIGSYRYTTNAKVMAEGGLRMLPIAGSAILQFGQRAGRKGGATVSIRRQR
jgi:hypothetical protein